MAEWTVKVTATVPQQYIEFERKVEADTKHEAEFAAEEEITDEMIQEKIVLDDVDYESTAETDAIECDECGDYEPADGTMKEVDGKMLCPNCAPEDEDGEEDEETEVAE